MSKRDFRRVEDFSRDEVFSIFDLTAKLKAEVKRGEFSPLLKNRSLAMLFEKPSLRTRTTFEIGMNQLGGNVVYFQGSEIGLGTRESIPDVARNLERWVDLIVARTFAQATVDGLADHARIPVINALSDDEHPCQAMVDFFTLSEFFNDPAKIRMAYVGDGNNTIHSLLLLGALLGAEVRVASPKGYEPCEKVVARARALHPRGAAGVWIGADPLEAAAGANALYTDVWASMGQEAETEKRAKIFRDYQLNANIAAAADPKAKIMHCLPAHRGQEITDDVLDGPNSIVFDQAENRLHVQKAIMAFLYSKSNPN